MRIFHVAAAAAVLLCAGAPAAWADPFPKVWEPGAATHTRQDKAN